jgi:hypothetical protein
VLDVHTIRLHSIIFFFQKYICFKKIKIKDAGDGFYSSGVSGQGTEEVV